MFKQNLNVKSKLMIDLVSTGYFNIHDAVPRHAWAKLAVIMHFRLY